MSKIIQNAAAGSTSPFLEKVYAYRYALGGLILALVAVLAWYGDSLGAMFAGKVKAEDVAGSWKFDAAEYDKTTGALDGNIPPAEAKMYKQQQAALKARYQGAMYTFNATGYIVAKAGKTQEFPCAYEGVSTNCLLVRPTGPGGADPMTLIVDPVNKHVYISMPDANVPLTRAD